VPSVSHLASIHLGLDLHKTPSRWRSWLPTATGPTSSGSPMTRRRCAGSLAAFPIPGCPSSGAPSCEQPTCGFDPRTSVWRFADPPCPGAPCQPGSPAATGIGGSHVRPPSVLMQPRATSAVTLPVPNHAIYQTQIRPLGKPLHIGTPAVDRDPHGWVACRRSWQARAQCCCRRRHNDQRTRWPRSRAGRFAHRRDRPRVPGPRADHQAPGSKELKV
jgi:hypothetical protein